MAEKQKLFQVGGAGAASWIPREAGDTVFATPAPFSYWTPPTQADNDLPVHLKGGGTDNILYRLTMGLCLGGECRACSA